MENIVNSLWLVGSGLIVLSFILGFAASKLFSKTKVTQTIIIEQLQVFEQLSDGRVHGFDYLNNEPVFTIPYPLGTANNGDIFCYRQNQGQNQFIDVQLMLDMKKRKNSTIIRKP